jgi:hypothetical protein
MTIERRFRVSLIVYALLAISIWFTMSDQGLVVGNRFVSVRLVALAILGLFVGKTLLHWKATQIQADEEKVLRERDSRE